jgi:hypothetical protein
MVNLLPYLVPTSSYYLGITIVIKFTEHNLLSIVTTWSSISVHVPAAYLLSG